MQPRQRQPLEPEHALAVVPTGEPHHGRPAVLREHHRRGRLIEAVGHGLRTAALRARRLLAHAATADRSSQPSSLKPTGSHAPRSAVLRHRGGRVAIGRPRPGAVGIGPSYEEALNALDVAERMGLDEPPLPAADLLVFPVLARDRQALMDLVRSTLSPLEQARGGAQPLLGTLTTYFDTGCVAAETARRLSLSVRALTYRLERVHTLTGTDPTDPAHRYTLQTAAIGARPLDWPTRPL